jgi:hypothetical protein
MRTVLYNFPVMERNLKSKIQKRKLYVFFFFFFFFVKKRLFCEKLSKIYFIYCFHPSPFFGKETKHSPMSVLGRMVTTGLFFFFFF